MTRDINPRKCDKKECNKKPLRIFGGALSIKLIPTPSGGLLSVVIFLLLSRGRLKIVPVHYRLMGALIGTG